MKLTADQVAFLDGLLDGLDDESDGAWQAICCDRIAMSGEFKNKDPHDVWITWITENAK